MTSRSTERRHERNRIAVANWKHPIGTRVKVTRANGRAFITWTESEAFLLDDAHALVRVRGIPGNTRLDRVRPHLPRISRR